MEHQKTSPTKKKNEKEGGPGQLNKGGKAISVFPTEVWIYPPEGHSIDIERLEEISITLRHNDKSVANGLHSARHAWRMENPHLDKSFKEAYSHIQDILSITTSRLGIPGGLREFGSWLNIIEPGGYHVIHNHAPHLLSGVLYLSDCVETARLVLRDPRPSRLCFTGTQIGPTEVPVASVAGSAIIFPGWLEHWVEENNSDRELAYIAFNLGGELK